MALMQIDLDIVATCLKRDYDRKVRRVALTGTVLRVLSAIMHLT
jgi:hypothetical protein